jgi:hypothetical protein
MIPAFRRLRQEEHEFEDILSYIVRPYLGRTYQLVYFLDVYCRSFVSQ